MALMASVLREVRSSVATARSRDPAARGVSQLEILATWPGVHALLAHRLASALYAAGVPLLPRAIAAISRAVTGIEIHPAARIGAGFFIDHGMGVVIGQTAEIGNDVTLYQGVTLGGTGFATGKRHPTVQDNVTIGSGAKLLGPITVGHGSKIGAGSVVIHDVPPNSTVVGNPGHPVRVEGRRPEGPDADWVHLPDPIADAIKALAGRIAALEGTAATAQEGESRATSAVGEAETRAEAPAHDGNDRRDAVNRSLGPNPAGG
jgi:serine O-acetyltransferase